MIRNTSDWCWRRCSTTTQPSSGSSPRPSPLNVLPVTGLNKRLQLRGANTMFLQRRGWRYRPGLPLKKLADASGSAARRRTTNHRDQADAPRGEPGDGERGRVAFAAGEQRKKIDGPSTSRRRLPKTARRRSRARGARAPHVTGCGADRRAELLFPLVLVLGRREPLSSQQLRRGRGSSPAPRLSVLPTAAAGSAAPRSPAYAATRSIGRPGRHRRQAPKQTRKIAGPSPEQPARNWRGARRRSSYTAANRVATPTSRPPSRPRAARCCA